MVAGTIIFTRQFVDDASDAMGQQRLGHQHMVNAQAAIAPKSHFAVVPPTVDFAFGIELAKGIGQPQFDQGLKMGPFFVGTVDGARQGHWVMNIAIVDRDVVIAHQCQQGVSPQLLA